MKDEFREGGQEATLEGCTRSREFELCSAAVACRALTPLTLTNFYGHMTNYVSRTFVPLRREDPHSRPPGVETALRELPQRVGESPGHLPIRGPGGAAWIGGRRDCLRAERRTNPPLQAQSSLLRI